MILLTILSIYNRKPSVETSRQKLLGQPNFYNMSLIHLFSLLFFVNSSIAKFESPFSGILDKWKSKFNKTYSKEVETKRSIAFVGNYIRVSCVEFSDVLEPKFFTRTSLLFRFQFISQKLSLLVNEETPCINKQNFQKKIRVSKIKKMYVEK